MALSVQRGIYKSVSVAQAQSIDASTGGSAANLSLSAKIAPFVLSASVHAQSTSAVGGVPIYPPWWSAYVAAERARQKASKEARAVQIDDVFVAGPLPFAVGLLEAEPARSASLTAVLRMPVVHAVGTVPRLVAIVSHAEPIDDDEALALLASALLLAA